MKRLVYIYMVLGMMMTSCTLETSDNGDLDGFWQLYQLDTLSTGGVADMREKTIFFAVQMRLLEIKNPSGDAHKNVIFRFEHQGDSLVIYNPRFNNREESDPEITDPSVLNQYGLYRLRESFFVSNLNDSNMDLKSDRFWFHFRKY